MLHINNHPDRPNDANGISSNLFALGPWQLRVVHNQRSIQQAYFELPSLVDTNSVPSQANSGLLAGPRSTLSDLIEAYLSDYLAQRAPIVRVPLDADGSAFQLRVWQQLRDIKPGQPMTYGALAKQLQTAAQPIGGACRRNPVAFFTPCHRVVAANGLGGFMGQSDESSQLSCKAWLLQHEAGFVNV